jgi:alkylation response protein AidB-like acyl-CoA dehydrogenase
MYFSFVEEQDLLRQSTRRFLDDRQSLAARQPRLEDMEVFDRADWRAAAELGWTSMLIPAEYGGGSVTDQPLVDLIVFGEELGRVLHSGPMPSPPGAPRPSARSNSRRSLAATRLRPGA